jgi:hypothetical protein
MIPIYRCSGEEACVTLYLLASHLNRRHRATWEQSRPTWRRHIRATVEAALCRLEATRNLLEKTEEGRREKSDIIRCYIRSYVEFECKAILYIYVKELALHILDKM